MKLSPAWRRPLACVTLLLGSLGAAGEDGPPIKPWDKGRTPALALADLEGRAVNLAALRGRVVVLNFWATWCEPCRAEMPSLDRLRDKLEDQPLAVYAVNYGESRERAAGFVAKERVATPVLLDPEKKAASEWKVGGLPMTFLIDARGRVRYWTFGERDWSRGEGLRLVEALLKEAGRAGS